MTIQVIIGGLGALLLVTGVLGGGLELKEVKIPQIGRVARACAFVLGLVFVGAAMGLGTTAEAPAEADAETKAYQQRVRSICNKDRDQDVRFARQQAAVVQQFEAGDEAAYDSWALLIEDIVNQQTAIKGEFEALDPPSDLDASHNDAVALWDRWLGLQRSLRDDLYDSASDPEQLEQVISTYDDAEDERLANESEVYLRRLAGSGCDPAGNVR